MTADCAVHVVSLLALWCFLFLVCCLLLDNNIMPLCNDSTRHAFASIDSVFGTFLAVRASWFVLDERSYQQFSK